MPILKLDPYHIHYELDGPENAPVLVLSNSLGTTLDMWAPQIDALRWKFRVLRYDTRGHGETSAIPGPYQLAQLGRDVLTLMDALNIERAHFCGISMGGLTGLWLGVHAPKRLNKLIVSNTAARIGTEEGWQDRAHLVRSAGIPEVADGAASRWFTPGFIQHQPERVEMLLRQLRGSPEAGYAACCDALAVADLRDEISHIEVPLLVIAGKHDPVTTPEDARFIVDRVKGARYAELEASHLSNVEASAAFTEAVLKFLVD
ncbi:3-oxoadipate enol-lactonase [Crenobacter sp. SG2305]|uniref:3-oxoadipate enol-lactonase n=1 Tax=Crenobacter oryzisoli TaxID=3056844 RepID=UPI0025AA3FAF|nr:3-oxoadipate enol-lactonase [Crenobacter sp. SG2305]MDN0081689.1 3-oxoadipate enol-lactonase [Crenobacter sp. SG2305]